MRSGAAIASFGSSALFVGATTILGLVATPFILGFLGGERFGAFRAMVEWGGYLAILELGLGGALLALLPRALAGGVDQVSGVLRPALRAYTGVAGLMLVGGGLLVLAVPWLVPVTDGLRAELQIAAGILAAGSVLVLATPFRALLESAQRGYVVNGWLLIQSLAIIALTLWLAWLGWGLIGMALGTLVGGVLFAAGVTISARRRWPELLAPPTGDASTWRTALWKANWTTLGLNVCGRISTQSDNIIIGLFLGPAMVTPFFLTQRLVQVAGGQVLAIGSAAWAGLADIYHSKDTALLHRRVIELTRLVVFIGGAALIPIVALNGAFVRLWVGVDTYAGEPLTILACITTLLASIYSLWGWIFRGAGILTPLLPVAIATAMVNVGVSVGATAALGWIEGPLVGTLAAQVLVTLWAYPLMLWRHLSLAPLELFSGLAAPVVAVATFGAGSWWVAHRWQPDSWAWFLAMMLGVGLSFALVSWSLLLTSVERCEWRGRLRAMLASRAPAGVTTSREVSP